ncbi:MAG TPA: hypothetical protein VFA52_04495 [Candidatus Paceibacterota bacterium]|nr:hypothetical protein [Candidatus Paceibacterota bacterium]
MTSHSKYEIILKQKEAFGVIFEISIYAPGISDFHPKTDEPVPFPPIVETFEASCNQEAKAIAEKIYGQYGFGHVGHYNIFRA